jgi:DNA-binding MarR family transcriptional regulator
MDKQRAIGYLLQHVAGTWGQQANQVLQERLGIGMSQFKILMMLQHEPHLLQRQLADHLGQTEASISRQMKLLVDKGMLVVRVNPASKREHLTVPTPKGIRLTEVARETLVEYAQPLYERLTEKQQKQLVDMLSTIHDWVCQPGKLLSCDHPYKV